MYLKSWGMKSDNSENRINSKMKNEIVVYQLDNLSTHLEVKVDNESVWLNRHQLAVLFDRDIKTIGKHIANVLKEELNGIPVVAKFATTASDGTVFHLGASLKDLGKKWFAFSMIDKKSVSAIIEALSV